MDRTIYLNNLYDDYQGLLTQKQQQYFEDYYFQNLSLSEMAENYHVSRNAIYGQLKLVEKKLEAFEQILKLYQKKQKVKELLKEIPDSDRVKQILDLLWEEKRTMQKKH